MSALPGGAADKLGGRFEDWWTLIRVADLLRGAATVLRLEPPGVEGAGVEFWVDEQSGRWCEQVKDAPAGGTWTLRRLIREGVLGSIAGHLAAGHQIRLVVSTPASDLDALATRARAATTVKEYRIVLQKSQREKLGQLARGWGVDETTAWEWLQHIHVEHHSPAQLRRLLAMTYEALVQGDPAVSVAVLRDWLDDALHQPINGPMAWAFLNGKGLRRRELSQDPSALASLTASVERHDRRLRATQPAFGVVQRPETEALIELVTSSERPAVVVVHGHAGSGKSTTAFAAVHQLHSAGWFTAAVSLDALPPGTRTANQLGAHHDIDGSPALVLAGVANGERAVLLVDQLDAVSEYSGRMPDAYDVVTEILEQAEQAPNLTVLLVARTVDLEQDRRMRALVYDQTRTATLAVGELIRDAVISALQRSDVDVESVDATTLAILVVPLHLAVFLQLPQDRRSDPHASRTSLYDAYTSDLRLRLERDVPGLDWSGITGVLVSTMSDRETLHAPESVLDLYPQRQVSALVSAGALVRQQRTVRFFHETYFDYLFARTFVDTGRRLAAFLVDSGQHLFRRAQTRQVLEYLSTSRRPEFRATVLALLDNAAIRSHLLDVVVRVLQQLTPEPDDWRALEPLAFGTSRRSSQLAALLALGPWFDAADAAGRWESLLHTTDTHDLAAHQLVLAARHRARRVADLIRPFVGVSENWRLRLRTLVQWSLCPDLVDLTLELIDRGDLDDARGPIAVNSDFFSMLYGLKDDDPAGAARIIGAYLRRALERARAAGEPDPFESRHIPPSSSGAENTITEVAAAAPSTFVKEVLPFVVELAEQTAGPRTNGGMRSGGRWRWRYVTHHRGVDDAVFYGIDDALRLLAHRAPHEADQVLISLMFSDLEPVRFLACRTLAILPDGNRSIDWLLSSDANLRLGWADSPRWVTRELVAHASETCDDEHLTALTAKLLNFYPEHERRYENRQIRGRSQYELLTAIPVPRLTPAASLRLGELERKLWPVIGDPQPPSPIVFRSVRAPISDAGAQRMRDDDWLRAIAKYKHDRMNWSGQRPVGGSDELSSLLASRAQDDPERFASLALRFDSGTPPVYFSQLIRAIADKVPPATLGAVCQHAATHAGQSIARDICAAAEESTAGIDDKMLRLLETFATAEDPSAAAPRAPTATTDNDDPDDENETLLIQGIHSTRGAAARAIAHVLFNEPQQAGRLLRPVEALIDDPVLAVRTTTADAVRALLIHDHPRGLGLADQLLSAELAVLDSAMATRLLTVAVLKEPQRFAPHLAQSLTGPPRISRRGGHVWAVAHIRSALHEPTPSDVTSLSAAARRGAAEALATAPADAADILTALFADANPEVREAAATAIRYITDIDPTSADVLVSAFIESPAFPEHLDSLFSELDQISTPLPLQALAACEKAIRIARDELGDVQTHRAITSTHIISVVMRIYREGTPAERERCLDVIDALADIGAYGLQDALADQR